MVSLYSTIKMMHGPINISFSSFVSKTPRPALGHTQPPICCVTLGSLIWEQVGRSSKLTTYLLIVSELKNEWSFISNPFMPSYRQRNNFTYVVNVHRNCVFSITVTLLQYQLEIQF